MTMPSARNFVTLHNDYGPVELHDSPLDDEHMTDDVLLDGSNPRPERRVPPVVFKNPALNPRPAFLFRHQLKNCLKPKCKFLLTNVLISVSVIVVVITLSLVLGWYSLLKLEPSPVIDKSVKAFNIPNHPASKRQDALEQAMKDLRNSWKGRHKRDLSPSAEQRVEPELFDQDTWYDYVNRRVKRATELMAPGTRTKYVTQALRKHKMLLVYLAKGEGEHNIFTPERLETIHKVEMDIMRHPKFTDFCYINYAKANEDRNLASVGNCLPLNTLLTYFYPSVSSDGKIHYDSLGNQLDDINRTIALAMTKESFFWYVDEQITSENKKSRLLRSEAHFGLPIPGYASSRDRRAEQDEQFRTFIATYVDKLEKASTKNVRVLYGGNEIFDYQIDHTFWNDLSLALYSGVFICVFMLVLTSFSVWLSFWGVLSILLSFPLALFFYRYVFSNIRLGILNGVAAFVIIGIGVDDVFVFVNTFRQAYHLTDLGDRMAHTVWIAGKATFFTSFTTAAAFAGNAASSIPAVHDFGLFMSLVVACCWIVVALMMPPVLNIWYRFFSRLESRCFSCVQFKVFSKQFSRLDLPADVVNFSQIKDASTECISSRRSSEYPDVPLLQIDNNVSAHEGGWPTYLGMLNRLTSQQRETEEMLLEADDPLLDLETELISNVEEAKEASPEGCGLTIKLQGILYHGVALPVVKTRWYLLVLYFILLVISVGLVTQLHPATKPPQLFKPDTNLQILMDLASNFSDDGITCDECSGFFKEGSKVIPTTTTERFTLTTKRTPSTSATQRTTLTPKKTSSRTTTTTTSRTTTTSSTTPKTTTSTEISGVKKTTPAMSKATTTRSTNTRTTRTFTTPTTTTSTRRTTTTRPTTTTSRPTTTTTRPTTDKSSITSRAQHVKTTSHHVWAPGTIISKPPIPQTTPRSVVPGYDPCANGKCDHASKRPNLETGAAIYVVFGLKGIDRSNISYSHVLTEKGKVIYDPEFEGNFSLPSVNQEALKDLCKVCKMVANNTELVKANGSQCIPQGLPYVMHMAIHQLKECRDLPTNTRVNGKALPARAMAGYNQTAVTWIAFAFESTTFKGQSSFSAYEDYQKWEDFIAKIRKSLPPDSPLQSIYQTSKFWKSVMMETVVVSSAFYGLFLSMAICAAAVAIFTGHPGLLCIVTCTIAGVILMVLAIFYLAGWEIGAVEAVSLSILVGSSVDYCVHLVEGYLLAGHNPPQHILESQSNPKLRQWRTRAAITHIGVSILSSAVTTIAAAIPLTQTIILPFSKFGEIVAISTTISIVYSLTFCAAFLVLFAPAKFTNGIKSTAIAFSVTVFTIGVIVVGLFVSVRAFDLHIPGPSGEDIFS